MRLTGIDEELTLNAPLQKKFIDKLDVLFLIYVPLCSRACNLPLSFFSSVNCFTLNECCYIFFSFHCALPVLLSSVVD